MPDIIQVQNTSEIPTANGENYVLINAVDDKDFQEILADFVKETRKKTGKMYKLGNGIHYYAEVIT